MNGPGPRFALLIGYLLLLLASGGAGSDDEQNRRGEVEQRAGEDPREQP